MCFGFLGVRFGRTSWISLGILSVFAAPSQAEGEPYEQCKDTFKKIINGTLQISLSSIGLINNETIWTHGLMHSGTFYGLDPNYPREGIITPSYKGCKAICGSGVKLNLPTTALGLVTTWVFPLAILLSLPYESLHERRIQGTISASLNWLGTPQTSLTATTYNFMQIAKCRQNTKACNNDPRWTDLYYVLSVFNQYDLPSSGPEQDRFVRTLIYGLYRTVTSYSDDARERDEVALTRELLSELAFQLRMLRRRAVIPTMASLATFLLAFIFSVVLSFADVGDNATVAPLVLGLLYGWLPVLVIFAIVDRNPVSSRRSSELMSRWLYNVNAIRTHFHRSNNNIVPLQSNQEQIQTQAQNPQQQTPAQAIQWWTTNLPRLGPNSQAGASPFYIGDFIGQGRKMQYCGLVPAVLNKAEKFLFDHDITSYDKCAEDVIKKLQSRRPIEWYAIAAVSLSLVWSQVLMAFMIAYNTPTVGFGCWSGGYLLFGLFSSISWVMHLFSKRPGRGIRVFCHVFNCLAVCWLITFTVLVLSGGFSNCACMTNFGSYMNFENALFYLKHCNVQKYWIGATVIGGLVPFCAFLVAVFGWLNCQVLWAANEGGPPHLEMRETTITKIDWGWLRYTVV